MQPLKRFELVSVVVPVGYTQTSINFPDQPQLRDDGDQDIIVRRIRTWSVDVMPASFNNQQALPTMAQLRNMCLVLYINNEESIHRLPLQDLANTAQGAAGNLSWINDPIEMQNLKIDWDKSYLEFAVAPSPGTIISVDFGVDYLKFASGEWAKLNKNIPAQMQ